MKLSLKAARFVIEALEHYRKYHDDRLRQPGLSDDDASDLTNDRQYLQEIAREFQEYLGDLKVHRPDIVCEEEELPPVSRERVGTAEVR